MKRLWSVVAYETSQMVREVFRLGPYHLRHRDHAG